MSIAAFVAGVDRLLTRAHETYPSGGAGAQLPTPGQSVTPTLPAGASELGTGAARVGSSYQRLQNAAAGLDEELARAAAQGSLIGQQGRGASRVIRDQARVIGAQAETIGRSPAGARLIIATMDQQLGAMQSQLDTTKTQYQGVTTKLRQVTAGYQALSYGDQPPLSPASGDPPKAPTPEADRRRNQIDAFKKLFGREPTSSNDWITAAALDPHSYDPKNGGAPPNIVVGRIKPVPGQGVVRTNLFIPGEKAWTPFGDNLGDNRGFNPNAGPEESRVTIYTDYDNGIVVARQNPSVMQSAGEIRRQAGIPDIQVSQNPNGAVLIKYHAADPFSPGGEDIAKATPWNVNGNLVIKPTPTGPIAGGTVSSFPAIEIYNDNAGHTVDLGHIMPRNTSPFGPLAGLPFSQMIGPQLMGEFPDTMVPGLYEPTSPSHLPPSSLPHPPTVARIPVPVVIPYPSVNLGDVANPPHVPIGK